MTTNPPDSFYPNKLINIFICGVLLITTASVYWQIHSFDFIGFDDNEYVYDNPHVKNGVTQDNVLWAFTAFYSGNWHPLTWISHMADCQLYGLKPGWHHVMNLIFHVLNTLLLFLVFKKMTARIYESAFVAALFALHPLHVESVAWISERKDLLSTCFFLLTMLAYRIYVIRPSLIRYLPVFLLFALGLMSKPMLVTLPFVLLLLDLWPLNRIHFKIFSDLNDSRKWAIAYHLILEKIPLFLLSAVSCVVTVYAQKAREAVTSYDFIPLHTRIANSTVSYLIYIEKMIYPSKLGILYPYIFVRPVWMVIAASCLMILISVLAILTIKKAPYLLVGWLWFLGTLIPVIGFVQVGYQSLADRYTYIPLIGLFIIITWGATDILKSWNHGKIYLALSASLILMGLAAITWKQIGYWKNSVTLFEHTLCITSENYIIHNNLGLALDQAGRTDEAIDHYLQAIRIMPNYVNPYYNMGIILAKKGLRDAAISYYLHAIRIKPNLIEAHRNLGDLLYDQGRVDDAIHTYLQVVKINPNLEEAHKKLGDMLASQARWDEAITQYLEAVKINPKNAAVYNNIGNVLYKQGRIKEAIDYYLLAIKLDPKLEEVYNNLGNALYKQGRIKEAIKEYRQALALKPDFAEAYNSLGVALIQTADIDNAIVCFKKALQINPDYNSAKNNLELLTKEQKKE